MPYRWTAERSSCSRSSYREVNLLERRHVITTTEPDGRRLPFHHCSQKWLTRLRRQFFCDGAVSMPKVVGESATAAKCQPFSSSAAAFSCLARSLSRRRLSASWYRPRVIAARAASPQARLAPLQQRCHVLLSATATLSPSLPRSLGY